MSGSAGEKKRLRLKIRMARKALPESCFRREAESLLAHLTAMPEWKAAGTVMAYAALPGEPDLVRILSEIWSSGRRMILPRCGEKEGLPCLVPCLVSGPDELSPGKWGIPEPGNSCPAVDPEEIGLILVPGIAFDRAGFRLGQGGGYYDSFLPETRGFRLGVCHSWELLPGIPKEPHDARVDAVLTERGILRI